MRTFFNDFDVKAAMIGGIALFFFALVVIRILKEIDNNRK